MALVALDQITLNLVQIVKSWDDQEIALFTTTEVWNPATTLYHRNFLESSETGNTAITALPLSREEVAQQETKQEAQ